MPSPYELSGEISSQVIENDTLKDPATANPPQEAYTLIGDSWRIKEDTAATLNANSVTIQTDGGSYFLTAGYHDVICSGNSLNISGSTLKGSITLYSARNWDPDVPGMRFSNNQLPVFCRKNSNLS